MLRLPVISALALSFAALVDAQDGLDAIPTPDEEFQKLPPAPTCYGGKVWNECGSSCVKTCDEPSPICTRDCVAKCECPAGKSYWNGLHCVSGAQCPVPREDKPITKKCSGGQIFQKCGSDCTRTCADPTPMCSKMCSAKCECPGAPNAVGPFGGAHFAPYWDAEKQECIAEAQCPVVTPTLVPTAVPTLAPTPECGGGQVYHDCASVCTPTCSDPQPFCTKRCVRKCACPASVPLWDGVSKCIAHAQCPERPTLKGSINLYYVESAPLSPFTFFEDVDTPVKTAVRYGILEGVGQKVVFGQHPNVTTIISKATEVKPSTRHVFGARADVLAMYDVSGPLRDAQTTLMAVNVEFEIEFVRCDAEANRDLQHAQKWLLESTKNGKMHHYLKVGGLTVPAVALVQNLVQPCAHDTDTPTKSPTKSPTVPTGAPTPAPTKTPVPANIEFKLQLSDHTVAEVKLNEVPLKHGIYRALHRPGIKVTIVHVAAITAADRAMAKALNAQHNAVGIKAAMHGEISEIDQAVVVTVRAQIKEPGCLETKKELLHSIAKMQQAVSLGLLTNYWDADSFTVLATVLQSVGEPRCTGAAVPTQTPTHSPTHTPAQLVSVLQLYSVSKEEFNGWSAESSKHAVFELGIREALSLPDKSIKDVQVVITRVADANAPEKRAAIAIVDDSGDDAKDSLPAIAVSFKVIFDDCSRETNHIVAQLPQMLKGKLASIMATWAGESLSVPALAVQNSMSLLCAAPTTAPTQVPTLMPTSLPTKTDEPDYPDQWRSPAPTPAMVYVNNHVSGQSHFESGKHLKPGVSVKLHLFGLPKPDILHKIKVRKVFEDAVKAAFCPAGPKFSDCEWHDDLGERVVIESYRTNANLAPGEKMFDASGAITGAKRLNFFEHHLHTHSGDVYEMAASRDVVHASTAVEVNFRIEFDNACLDGTQKVLKSLPGKMQTMVQTGAMLTYLFALQVTAIGYPETPVVYRGCDPNIDLQMPPGRTNPEESFKLSHTAKCVWTGHKVHVLHQHQVGEHQNKHSIDRSFLCRHYVSDSGTHECGCSHWEKKIKLATMAPTKFDADALFATLTPAPTPPTKSPTSVPSSAPTAAPTLAPTSKATPSPTIWPTAHKGWKVPTTMITNHPSKAPTTQGTVTAKDKEETPKNKNKKGLNTKTNHFDAEQLQPTTAPTLPFNRCGKTGQVWKQCGGCTLTCHDLQPDCVDVCVEKCECPTNAPIYHEGRCITYAACPAYATATRTIKVDDSKLAENPRATFPPEHSTDINVDRDCLMSEFTPTTACSRTCGGGWHVGVRTLIMESSGNGKPCGRLSEKIRCNTGICPVQPTPSPPPTVALPTFTPTTSPTFVPTHGPTALPTPVSVPLKYKNFIQLESMESNIQAMAGDGEHIFLAAKTQIVKVRKSDMKQVAKLDLWPVYKMPTTIAVDETSVYVTVTDNRQVSSQVLLKLSKTDLQIHVHRVLPSSANVPYTMTVDERFLYTGHYTIPGQVLKLSKLSLTVLASVKLDAGEDDVRQLEMDGQYLFANCNTKPGKIVKINKDEMVKVKTTTLPVGANNPLAGCLAPANMYNGQQSSLFVGTSSSPSVIVKLQRDNLLTVMSRALTVGYVSAMACDASHIYAATYTEHGKLMKIRQSDLEQVQQLSLGSGGGTGMIAAISAGKNNLYAATDTENGRVYQVSGMQDVATTNIATAPEFDAP